MFHELFTVFLGRRILTRHHEDEMDELNLIASGFQLVSMDFVTPLPKTRRRSKECMNVDL